SGPDSSNGAAYRMKRGKLPESMQRGLAITLLMLTTCQVSILKVVIPSTRNLFLNFNASVKAFQGFNERAVCCVCSLFGSHRSTKRSIGETPENRSLHSERHVLRIRRSATRYLNSWCLISFTFPSLQITPVRKMRTRCGLIVKRQKQSRKQD